jgi:hypothetical protein
MRALLRFTLAGTLFLLASASEAKPSDSLEAQATKLYRAGDFRRAAELLQEVLRKSPGPEVHKALAACYLKLADPERAAHHLREFLRSNPSPEDRQKAEQRLREVEEALTTSPARIESTPPGATVYVDDNPQPLGQTPLTARLVVGEHKLRFVLPGREEMNQPIVVARGAPAAVAARFPELSGAPPPPVPAPAPASPPFHLGPALGLGLVLLPAGTGSLSSRAAGLGVSGDLAFSVAVAPYFDYQLLSFFSLGFSPIFTFNQKSPEDTSSASEMDLCLRLRFGYPAHDRFYPRVVITPGYALWFPSGDTWSGFHIGVAGGADLRISQSAWFFFEAGYRISFLSLSQRGASADLHLGYVNVTFGVQYAL